MGIYIEAIILYILIFFSGSAAAFSLNPGEFSITAEIYKSALHTIPSLALIWYLVNKSKMTDVLLVRGYYVPASTLDVRFRKNDLISAARALPCLLAAGIVTTIASSISGTTARIIVYAPVTAAGWITLCVSCFLGAYLEESYFRFYLLSKRNEFNLNAKGALALSVILFAACHIYAGPWSFINALISGVVLGFIFLRYNAIHGLAIAHGLYNIIAYYVNTMSN